MVFTYGVRDVTGSVTPSRCAAIWRVWRRSEARSGPRLRATSRRASTHSRVSTQSGVAAPSVVSVVARPTSTLRVSVTLPSSVSPTLMSKTRTRHLECRGWIHLCWAVAILRRPLSRPDPAPSQVAEGN